MDGAACLNSTRGVAGRVTGRLALALVGTQVALAVVVAVGAALMVRSLDTLLAVDPGMDGSQVLTLRPNPPGGRYPDGASFQRYYSEVIDRIETVPGVESVGAINLLPGTLNNWSFPTYPDGVDLPEGSTIPSVNFRAVRPGYFETMRIPLRNGRTLAPSDHADAAPVALVNEAFVEEYWPDQRPLGRAVRLFARDGTPYGVVGVVGDVRQHGRSAEPRAEMYFAHDQVPWNQMAMWLMVRVGSDDPLAYAEAVRTAVRAVDPDVPIAGLDDMNAVLGRSTRTTRFITTVLTAFGLSALVLGGIGVFGVTSYTVARRVPEFGIRIALGSSRPRVLLGRALGRSLAPVVIGLTVGTVAAAFASQLLEAMLYGVAATDPVAFASVVSVLFAIGLAAVLVPAWHATAVDPVTALRSD